MTLLFLCQINVVPEIQGTVNVEAASRKTKKNARNAYKKREREKILQDCEYR